jgi:hypothetical protein
MPPESGAVLLVLEVPDESVVPDAPEEDEEDEDDVEDAGGWNGTALRRSSAMRCSKTRASWASSTWSRLLLATPM